MNRVTCRECGELAFESPFKAEDLEGCVERCPHCDSLGRIVLRENDEGGLSAIELVALPDPKETSP